MKVANLSGAVAGVDVDPKSIEIMKNLSGHASADISYKYLKSIGFATIFYFEPTSYVKIWQHPGLKQSGGDLSHFFYELLKHYENEDDLIFVVGRIGNATYLRVNLNVVVK